MNIYVGDKKSQSTEGGGAPTGDDDPDKAGNEGIEFEWINVGEADGQNSMCVMQEDGTTHRLEIRTDDYDLVRLVDALEEIDMLAKIDVSDLKRNAPPLLPQVDFPSLIDRAESGKIIRMLMVGMRSLWHPVIRAIADHATMTSLGEGKGKDVAAAVGRQRVIEGLRIAESIRKGLGREERKFSMWQSQVRARQEQVTSVEWRRSGRYKLGSVDEVISGTLAVLPDKSLPLPVRAPPGHYWNLAAGPVIKITDTPLAGNDNFRSDTVALQAA